MKAEFTKLLATDNYELRLNGIIRLRRSLTDFKGQPRDVLYLIIDNPTGSVMDVYTEIKSRDIDGIINEVCEETAAFAQKWAAAEIKKLQNGYLH